MNRKSLFYGMVAALALISCAAGWPDSAYAADVEIHGYGNQDFMNSSGNQYLGARSGSWDERDMSLVFIGKATDDTSIWTKISSEQDNFVMEWFYVDHKVGHNLIARAGQMRSPVGIYNPYIDNKFLHLSEVPPMMYNDDLKIIFDSVRGIDAELMGPLGVEMFFGVPHKHANDATALDKEEERNLFGGRVNYKTPLEGLVLTLSGAEVTEKKIEDSGLPTEIIKEGHETRLVASLDYINYGIDFKAEYAKKKWVAEENYSYYIQAGYTFFDKLIPFVRYDYLVTDVNKKRDPSFYQKDITVGAGFKINDYIKLKAEEHLMRGYALPVATSEVVPGDGNIDWNLFVAGVDFIF